MFKGQPVEEGMFLGKDIDVPGMGGAELFPAGRGEDENPRGKEVRKSIDPEIRQKCVNCYWGICTTV